MIERTGLTRVLPEAASGVLPNLIQTVEDAAHLGAVALGARRDHAGVGRSLGGEAPFAEFLEGSGLGERQREGIRCLGWRRPVGHEDGQGDEEGGNEGALHRRLRAAPIYRTGRLLAFLG